MKMPGWQSPASRWKPMTAITILAVALGAVLFVLALRRAGLGVIGSQIVRLGWPGVVGILALSGFRFAARAAAWSRAVEQPARLPFREALTAVVMSEPLANLTPLSTLLSEPAKAVFVGRRLPLTMAFSSLVTENILYTGSLALIISLGATAFLVAFRAPGALRIASIIAISGMVAVLAAAWVVLRTRVRPLSGFLSWLDRHRLLWRRVAERLDHLRQFESRLATFCDRQPAALAWILAWEGAFHLAGIGEVYLTLTLISTAPPLLVALILESTGRLINVLFRFVPMRVGVDEAGAGLLTAALGMGTAAGVTLALVRKARVLAWAAVGLVLLLARGLSLRQVIADARQAQRPAG